MKTETNRSTAFGKRSRRLRHMTVGQLKEKYREVFGEVEPVESQAVPVPADRLAHPGERAGRPFGARAPARTGDRQRCRPAHPRAEELPEGRNWTKAA